MEKIKLGLVGLGRIGKVHAENLVYRVQDADLLAVADPMETTRDFANNLGIKNFHTDPENIFSNKEIDAVVICSPTPTHLSIIENAAERGKHIFCEKPLEMTVQKIQQIIDITKQNKVKLQVGFNRRFDANYRRVWTQVTSGKIGEPHILKITSRDPAPPSIDYIKSSGGMFMDMTIHDFDMARGLSLIVRSLKYLRKGRFWQIKPLAKWAILILQ